MQPEISCKLRESWRFRYASFWKDKLRLVRMRCCKPNALETDRTEAVAPLTTPDSASLCKTPPIEMVVTGSGERSPLGGFARLSPTLVTTPPDRLNGISLRCFIAPATVRLLASDKARRGGFAPACFYRLKLAVSLLGHKPKPPELFSTNPSMRKEQQS